MIGLPLIVGIALWKIDCAGAHYQPDCVQTFGWIYSACEAKVFYYGLLNILRRTAFVLISKLADDPLAQSIFAILLVTGLWGFHVKLEPYRDYFLDLLDMVLLGCLFLIALGSLAFNAGVVDWNAGSSALVGSVGFLSRCVPNVISAGKRAGLICRR